MPVTLVSALMLLLWAVVPAPQEPSPVASVEREAWVMGTRVGIVVAAGHESLARDRAETVLREVERFERLLSTWDPDTPLSRLNRAKPHEWIDVEPELAGLLQEVNGWADRTGGAFEPRIGALVDSWDSRGSGRVPSPADLSESLGAVGETAIQLQGHRLRRSSGAAWIDAGGFGKGAALRSVAGLLGGASNDPGGGVLIDLGGQVLVLAPTGTHRLVNVAHPVERRRSAATLRVKRGSVATSGTSQRGRHVLDPRTGHPVSSWGSVTVVHPDALVADILSTALYVMGPAEGLRWAGREGIAALFLELRDLHVTARWTPDLEPLLADLAESIEPMNH